MKSREYTPEEVQEKFLKVVWNLVDHWEKEGRAHTSQAKLEGLAHSIMALIDGNVGFMPAFILAPLPHKEDKSYYESQGQNFFPCNPRSKKTGASTRVKCDIGGHLAYKLFRIKEQLDKAKENI